MTVLLQASPHSPTLILLSQFSFLSFSLASARVSCLKSNQVYSFSSTCLSHIFRKHSLPLLIGSGSVSYYCIIEDPTTGPQGQRYAHEKPCTCYNQVFIRPNCDFFLSLSLLMFLCTKEKRRRQQSLQRGQGCSACFMGFFFFPLATMETEGYLVN